MAKGTDSDKHFSLLLLEANTCLKLHSKGWLITLPKRLKWLTVKNTLAYKDTYSINIRLGWMWLIVTNTLAYFKTELIKFCI